MLDNERAGKDDEAKMAAQLRVLPIRGQETHKEQTKTKGDMTYN